MTDDKPRKEHSGRMRTLIQRLDPRTFDLRAYLREFEFCENFRFPFKHLRRDMIAGLTAAIVALPLASGFGLLAFTGGPGGTVARLYGAILAGVPAALFRGASSSDRASNESIIEVTPWLAEE